MQMKRARGLVFGVVSVGVASWVGACSSSSSININLDGGLDGQSHAEAGPDVHEEMFGFDQGTDTPAVDSPTDTMTDSPFDQTSEAIFDVVHIDAPPPDAPPDVPSDVVDDFIEEVPFEDTFFEGGFEDDAGFCTLPDGGAAAFPSGCATCLEESCCKELSACDADPACKSIADCIGKCLGKDGSTCEVTCYDAADAGKALASELINCMNEDCSFSSSFGEGSCR
jgi:hypothetical protein